MSIAPDGRPRKRRLRDPEQTRTQTASTALQQNPATATAAVGVILSGLGALLGWTAEVQAAVAQITLGVALLTRLGVLAWQNARRTGPDDTG